MPGFFGFPHYKTMEDRKIIISTGSLFKVLAFVVSLYIAWLVWEILLVLFVSIIFAALIDPFATWFQKNNIPRGLAVITIYLLLAGVFALAVALLAPVIVTDIPQLIQNLQDTWGGLQQNQYYQNIVHGAGQIQQALGIPFTPADATTNEQNLNFLSQGLFNTLSGVFNSVVSLVLVLVITFYLVVQEDPMKILVKSFLPSAYVPYATNLLQRIGTKLALWVRGQIILSVIIGLLVFIGLSLLGIKHAAALALIAAILEFVPYVGPTLAAAPGVFLSFTQGGLVLMIFVIIMYVIIQALENHILVPKIMQKVVGLNPVVSIVAILTGIKLAGVLGGLLAIPVATAISVFLHDIITYKKEA